MTVLRCYLDWGNSRVKAWICSEGAIAKAFSFLHALQPSRLFEVLPVEFTVPVASVSISSVLDDASNEHLAVLVKDHWGVEPEFAKSDALHAEVRNGYESPGALGIDRWLNILAVSDFVSVCVVSCGTALTIDILRQRQHLGGYILPGMRMQVDALVQGTRRVRPAEPEEMSLAPGRSTEEAVYHGMLLSAVASIAHVYGQLALQSDEPPALILTGGDAHKLGTYLQIRHVIIPELLLRGLQRYFGHERLS